MIHKSITITNEQARRFQLAHQGLLPPRSGKGKEVALEFIRRVGCIQFDPLNIVGQNPELVLQSRIKEFRPAMLRELLYEDRRLLDGWDKMMSIYAVEDWPYFRRGRESTMQDLGHRSGPIHPFLEPVRQAIRDRGPLSSNDLEFNEIVDWPWAPTRASRAALESLYYMGDLIVHHKVHTRKVYDMASRHISEALLSAPEPNPTEEQYHDWRILRRLGGFGLIWGRSGDAWLGLSEIKRPQRDAAIKRLIKQGRALEFKIEGIETPIYMRAEDKPLLEEVLNGVMLKPRAAIIAPLDNLLWDRKFLSELFGFDYRWEVYKPEAERKYGYYVLPVLYGDRFVARFEPGRSKKKGPLLIKNWWWEPGIKPTKEMKNALTECFKLFVDYLGTDGIELGIGLEQALGWLGIN